MTTNDIRVLIADDARFFRDGLRLMLDTTDGVVCVGEAADGEQAAALAETAQPDVILMDINMPVLNGLEATRRIVARSPHIAVLMLTMHDDDDSVFEAMRAGARGYLLKEADREDVLRAVRAVRQGEAIFGPTIARRLMGYFAGPRLALAWQPFPELTRREQEVLALLAREQSNAQIARQLDLSAKTVRNHVSNILSKLQVASRAEAAERVRSAGHGGSDG